MMEKHLIEAFNLLMLFAVLSFPFFKIKGKAIIIEGTDLVSINGKGAKALFSTSTTISGSQVDIN